MTIPKTFCHSSYFPCLVSLPPHLGRSLIIVFLVKLTLIGCRICFFREPRNEASDSEHFPISAYARRAIINKGSFVKLLAQKIYVCTDGD